MVSGDDPDDTVLLQQACAQSNIENLSDTEKDACFLAGLFAPVRFAKAITLMLDQEAEVWTEDSELGCEDDLNNAGVVDGAQVTACALTAIGVEDTGGDVCLEESSMNGEVRWERVADYAEVAFQFESKEFANLIPVRVVINPGPQCPGQSSRSRYRLIAQGDEPSLAITDGFCQTDISNQCSEAEPGSGCWPCPIPRADGSGALTLSNTLLSPVNREAELMLFVIPNVESVRLADRLESTRQRLCEPAEGTSDACSTREDGATLLTQSALEAYFEQ